MKGKRDEGFSLIEAMVAFVILGIVAAGVSSVTMISSRISHSNVYENTAYNVAQAYAEQIKSISYGTIRSALNDPSTFDIPTESLMLGLETTSDSINIDDPLTFNVPMEKDVVIDIKEDGQGGFSEKTMPIWVTVTGRDLAAETSSWDAIEITIDFAWEVFDGTGMTRETGQVKVLKTSISE